jgi:hypothetical protein
MYHLWSGPELHVDSETPWNQHGHTELTILTARGNKTQLAFKVRSICAVVQEYGMLRAKLRWL